MKTRAEWFAELPPGYREMAIANTQPFRIKMKSDTMADSLAGAFDWEESPEGHCFWAAVANHYGWVESRPCELPPLP